LQSLESTTAGSDPADTALIRWNREHPLTAIASAYRENEWPLIDTWEMPTFYFLKAGVLQAKVVGWQREQVMQEMRKLGLIP